MIKLFVTDLDGCITTPFKVPDWDVVSAIRRINDRSGEDASVPPLSICSGRPLPYVEAVAQWLGIRLPVVFESGGLYEPETNLMSINGVLGPEQRQAVQELKEWMERELVPAHPGSMIEFSKVMDAGFVHPDRAVIDRVYDEICEYVTAGYPEFEIHHTDVSVNVVLKNLNKRSGILRLCETLSLTPDEVAYIGDSSGDIPALRLVGRSFAPANAQPAVKEVVDRVLEEHVTEAVLQAYRSLISG